MKSYVKIYGPPIAKAIKTLEKMAVENPKVCISDVFIATVGDPTGYFPSVTPERCATIISRQKRPLVNMTSSSNGSKNPLWKNT